MTNDDALATRLRLMRNHGLSGRDTCEMFAYNSRLDTVQAVVADHLLDKIYDIYDARIRNSHYLDSQFKAFKASQFRIGRLIELDRFFTSIH